MALNLEEIYVDLHQNPELSFQEFRTAGIVAGHLEDLGYEVHTEIGQTGVVGVLFNGDGPTVLLRADMDGLPVLEETGLDYASEARGTDRAGNDVPVMHACGHDVHVTALLGAAEELAETTNEWSGTVIALFQPAEEEGGGAQAMVDDGLYDIVPTPDVVLGQHVGPLPAGLVGLHAGVTMAAADSIGITMHGVGGHGSRPETTVDPVLMTATLAVRLQQIVSREVGPLEQAVVTVGQIHGGTKNNIIPAKASLGLSVRTFNRDVRSRVIGAIERIANAEAEAAGAVRAPEIEYQESFPLTVNDPDATERARTALTEVLGADHVIDSGVVSGSEDVGVLADAVGAPLVYWFIGGSDHSLFVGADFTQGFPTDIASNHSPLFAPVIEPTLSAGVRVLVTAAREWLA
ncbi:amidohydrolase [Timonella senegalensis]|uniref:amidohydrolase n=1 Tax=Timonella senegalensis TaxID=1465825 RepID=UPI0028ACE3DC|nr:amidohydrolase [Timonella senegalensis]